MYVRKGLLAVIIIASLLLGAVGVCAVLDIDVAELISGDAGSDDTVTLTADEYDEYLAVMNTYSKADILKDYITDYYYVPVDEQDLDEGMYRGMFDSLDDPYSYYMTAEEYENEMVSLTGNYSGIGVTFSMDTSNNFVILAVTAGSPAEEAGILPGDYIVKVNGETFGPDEFNTIATKIRGESGTQVTLTILRGSKELEFTMTRRKISTQSVSYEMKDGETGYIYISSFEQNTGSDFKKALKSLEKSGAKYLVVDIRDNPGGLVNSAVQVADELMGKGTVVYIQDQAGSREYYTTEAGRTKLPYVLLVNENSASSSEILAAGIQDNNEGTIVGTMTFGKGIIQGMQELTDGSAFRMTEYQYFSPNGSVIHKKGITPDYIVEFEDGDLDENGYVVYDRQLERAIEILKSGK